MLVPERVLPACDKKGWSWSSHILSEVLQSGVCAVLASMEISSQATLQDRSAGSHRGQPRGSLASVHSLSPLNEDVALETEHTISEAMVMRSKAPRQLQFPTYRSTSVNQWADTSGIVALNRNPRPRAGISNVVWHYLDSSVR